MNIEDVTSRKVRMSTTPAIPVPTDAGAPGAPRVGELWTIKGQSAIVRVTGVVQVGGHEAYIRGYEVERKARPGLAESLANFRSVGFSRLDKCVSTGE